GIEGTGAKATTSKGLRKSFQSFTANRFGAVERRPPGAQVERRAFLIADLSNTQIIGEVWPATCGSAVTRNCLQPSERFLKKSRRRHENAGGAHKQRLNDVSN